MRPRPTLVEVATGAAYESPVTEQVREGQFDGALRPLPDGHVAVTVRIDDGRAEVWALDPGTGTWTVHPAG